MNDQALSKIEEHLQQIHCCLGDKQSPIMPLSFRDQCAIAAMQAIVSNSNDRLVPKSEGQVIEWAFSIADAMESERKKRGDK